MRLQQLNYLAMAFFPRSFQGRPAFVAFGIHVGACLEQNFDGSGVANPCCINQGRPAIFVFSVDPVQDLGQVILD